VQSKKLGLFHDLLPPETFLTPPVVDQERLYMALLTVRSGQYESLTRAIHETHERTVAVGPDFLRLSQPHDLESIAGVGPKTARYFIMYSRPNAQVAALDTHILRWLQMQGYDAPKATPSSPETYRRLEKAFLLECERRGRAPNDLDLEIWKTMRSKK
jgi:thermostable 8-oxoguanine DNA glycosylase